MKTLFNILYETIDEENIYTIDLVNIQGNQVRKIDADTHLIKYDSSEDYIENMQRLAQDAIDYILDSENIYTQYKFVFDKDDLDAAKIGLSSGKYWHIYNKLVDFLESLGEDYPFEFVISNLPSEQSIIEIYTPHKHRDITDKDGNFSLYNLLTLEEDTIKTSAGKWVNKGNSGETHGTFTTKKAADAQRKAMFANKSKNANWGESIEKCLDETYSRDELKNLIGKVYNQQKIDNIYRRKKYSDTRLFAKTECTKCGREKKVFLSNLLKDPKKYGSCICSDTNINSKIDNAEKLYSNKKLLKSNTSGYTGVSYIKSYKGKPYGKWRAYIEIDGKRSYLGDFNDKKDAIKARKEAGEKGIKWYKDNRNKLIKDVRKRAKKYKSSKYRDTDRKTSVLKKSEN